MARSGIVGGEVSNWADLNFSSIVGAASNNLTQLKAAAGSLHFVSLQSIASVPVYLKLFNKASASVNAGTTAADMQFMCPANATGANGAGLVLDLAQGIPFSVALSFMLTTGISLSDNTPISASQVIMTLGWA